MTDSKRTDGNGCTPDNGLPTVEPCCCGPKADADAPQPSDSTFPRIVGSVDTAAGEIPKVETTLRMSDRLGTWRARWAIGRMRYAIEPGLYAVGQPTPDSPVLVSANYKMSFDRLRRELGRLDAWILVLDTRGINVWCAAGKGTFGTDELVDRIETTRLAQVVAHRKLIVPQLGAPGVAAHEVKKQSGFRVVYGPIRAEDLPEFLDAGMKATADMRRVRFPLAERLAVAPVELVMGMKYVGLLAVCLLMAAGLGPEGYLLSSAGSVGMASAVALLTAYAGGVLLTAALLPYLPGKALALKGMWLGLAFVPVGFAGPWWWFGQCPPWPTLAAWGLLLPAMTSFTAMNFTGTTTYTSLSGVRKEMAVAVPLQAVFATAGLAFWLVGRFV